VQRSFLQMGFRGADWCKDLLLFKEFVQQIPALIAIGLTQQGELNSADLPLGGLNVRIRPRRVQRFSSKGGRDGPTSSSFDYLIRFRDIMKLGRSQPEMAQIKLAFDAY
jgi:hypothetical protein